MTSRTASESLVEYKKNMGDELGEVFHHCAQHLFDLSVTWDLYETLFQNKERIDLQNKCSGLLTFSIQRHFYNAVLLGITRLLDPPSTLKSRNLSFQSIPPLCEESCRTIVHPLVRTLITDTEPLKLARNKIIAHSDLDIATGKSAKPSLGSRNLITSSFEQALKILNVVLDHYCGSSFHKLPEGNSPAINHLYYLHAGQTHDALIKQYQRKGIGSTPTKIEWPSWLVLGSNEENRYSR